MLIEIIFWAITVVGIAAILLPVVLFVSIVAMLTAKKLLNLPSDSLPQPPILNIWKKLPSFRDLLLSDAQLILSLLLPLILFFACASVIAALNLIHILGVEKFAWLPAVFDPDVSVQRKTIIATLSVMLGCVIAYGWQLLQFNSGHAKQHTYHLAEIFLLLITGLVALLAVLDNFLTAEVLSFTVFYSAMAITYLVYWSISTRKTHGGMNLVDLGASLYFSSHRLNPKPAIIKIGNSIRRANITEAYFRLKAYTIWMEAVGQNWQADKSLLKLMAMIYYRLRRYDKVVRIAQRGNDVLKINGEHSSTLLSFAALAQLNLGRIREAERTLLDGIDKAPSNPYFRYELAYVHREKGELDQAIAVLAAVIAQFNSCERLPPLLLNVHLLCDIACRNKAEPSFDVAKYAEEASRNLAEIDALISRVEHYENIFLGTVQRNYAAGRICLMEGRYREAFQLFTSCNWQSSLLGPRFYLALLSMIGTSDYSTPIRMLRRILYTRQLRQSWLNLSEVASDEAYLPRFYFLVSHNLSRALRAQQDGIIFNENLLFAYQDTEEILPVAAIAEAKSIDDSLEWNRRNIRSDFIYLPQRLVNASLRMNLYHPKTLKFFR